MSSATSPVRQILSVMALLTDRRERDGQFKLASGVTVIKKRFEVVVWRQLVASQAINANSSLIWSLLTADELT